MSSRERLWAGDRAPVPRAGPREGNRRSTAGRPPVLKGLGCQAVTSSPELGPDLSHRDEPGAQAPESLS